MKKTTNRRVIILSDLDSGYFEQAVFFIKATVRSSEDVLINEANNIVNEFSKKYAIRKSAARCSKKYVALKITAAISTFVSLFLILYGFFQ
ncbi:MAG: hypothetical protein IJE46_05085 [Clostridia bacterium]|nr:hypothetical protein [Clostridia bacterium]